ncbi:Alkylglycerone-phosphate synthase [Plasmodiophora brassicae]
MTTSSGRISRVAAHLTDEGPRTRPDVASLRWNGWGYADTMFRFNKDGVVEISGDRYDFSGSNLPHLRPFMESRGADPNAVQPFASLDDTHIDAPREAREFLEAAAAVAEVDQSKLQRIRHGHGHSLQEIYALRSGRVGRVPDSVVFVSSTEAVNAIVQLAIHHNVALIPFGGGTSVTHALVCPEDEPRHICSVDMSRMDRVLWVDAVNMEAEIQAGAVGKFLEADLNSRGFCLGHEPDSHEFSSLGGWIATRASGMKKNEYGNIEDIVVQVTMVTPSGVVRNTCRGPRQSIGPDIRQIVLGSEGTLGIITSAVVRIRRLPQHTEHGSLIFPDFAAGVAFMHEVALRRAQPASIRLVDNEQFQFGRAIKPSDDSWHDQFSERFKKWVIARLGFDVTKMVAATLMFEGSAESIARQKSTIFRIARAFDGYSGGAEAGKRGYRLTFLIAYIRDFVLSCDLLAESFETSVEWSNVTMLCERVRQRIVQSCQERGVPQAPFVSCRVTQTYDTGACVYFYFAIIARGLANPVDVFSSVEHDARQAVLDCGGSLSHHHGVGKIRKQFMPQVITKPGRDALVAIKRQLDPTNVFACGNLI